MSTTSLCPSTHVFNAIAHALSPPKLVQIWANLGYAFCELISTSPGARPEQSAARFCLGRKKRTAENKVAAGKV